MIFILLYREEMKKEQEKLKLEILEKRNSAFKDPNESSSSSEEGKYMFSNNFLILKICFSLS